MNRRPNKITKEEMRKKLRLTRPPRLEGRGKKRSSKPVRKKKGSMRSKKEKRV